jgi:hypothetical protein
VGIPAKDFGEAISHEKEKGDSVVQSEASEQICHCLQQNDR